MQKRLKPTLREKKRYVLAKGTREGIDKAILEFIGVLGYSKSGIKYIKDEHAPEGWTVIAINREKLNEIRASLAFKNIEIKRVSGTLKGLLK
jgi:RNase P/RNase MRP subunit POP5